MGTSPKEERDTMCLKIYSTSTVTSDMRIKTTRDTTTQPLEWLKFKSQIIPNSGENTDQGGRGLIHCQWECEMENPKAVFHS